MHTAKVILTCDIEYKGKIIFENKHAWFYADVDISNIELEDGCFSGCSIDSWSSNDAIEYGNKDNYLYTVIMNEWCSDSEVEDFDIETLYSEFTLLVKSEEYDDLEVDYGMFEPNY